MRNSDKSHTAYESKKSNLEKDKTNVRREQRKIQRQIRSGASDRKDEERVRAIGKDKEPGNGEKECWGTGNSVQLGASDDFCVPC